MDLTEAVAVLVAGILPRAWQTRHHPGTRQRPALYGLLDLTRDKQGLAHARALKALLDQAVQLLEDDKALPDAVPPPVAAGTVKNPFG